MPTTRSRPRALRTLTTTFVLALLAALLLAGSALAVAKPGKPTAKAPKGTITTTKPTFTWSKAPRAVKYELRVYKGTQVQLKKTGLKKTTWTSTKALPTGVGLTWKVRASNARGSGAWSKSPGFRITTGLAIGDAHGGGIVAYILQPGDPGYAAGQTHGLIAATADQNPAGSGIRWALPDNENTFVDGATGISIGTGAANTDAIIQQNGAGTTYAAALARAHNGGGYSDWYLPSHDELNQLYLNRAAIGGFEPPNTTYPRYWSSSQVAVSASAAWYHDFNDGFDHAGYWKSDAFRVRAVRAF